MDNAQDVTTGQSIRPMKLSGLFDKSFQLTPKIFKVLFPFYVLVAFLDGGSFFFAGPGAQNLSESPANIFSYSAILLVRSAVAFYLFLLVPLITVDTWKNAAPTPLETIRKKISWGLVGRFVLLGIRISTGVILILLLCVAPIMGLSALLSQPWIMFLIPLGFIPPVLYLFYRVLSYYILIIEDRTVVESIKKSREVMKLGKWYKSTSPLFRVAVLGFFLMVLQGTLGGILGYAQAPGTVGQIGLGAACAASGVNSLLMSFVGVFSLIAYTAVYLDAIARFEGADLLDDISKD